jgi:hypothetical protein
VASTLLSTSPALAQSESDKATARELGQQGEKALAANDWAHAEDFFRRADGLFHAPTLMLGLARAQAHEGKFVEAWENYHRIVLENVTSPPVFGRALADAQAELPSVEGQRARLTITVTGADAPRVTVNDVPVKAAALGVARFVDPGHLVVTAAADGVATAMRTIDLAPGKEDTVSIALNKDVAAPVVAGGPVPAAAVATESSGITTGPSGSIMKPVGIGALALGGVGLIVGGVTGGIALGKHSDLKTACPNGSCDTTASQSTLSSYNTMGTLSTVGFIVGGVGVASGIVLLVLAPKSDSKPASTASPTFRPYVGFGTAGAVGTF